MPEEKKSEEKFAIRFGLGALKAVGFNMMEVALRQRKENGPFKDIYDFTTRLDPRSINKKSIEALAKAGAFDKLVKNRRQVAESFDILSSFAFEKSEEASSNQMNLFGESNKNPDLKKVEDWNKIERLQKEFEAFGFFLNEHPIDDFLSDLKKRGVVFSDKLERDELVDGNLIKMAGVVAGSKHRSSARGRFAYLYVSDPFAIFEAMIFDEAIITNARDILIDGSLIALECLIKKDDGGTRILVRDVKKLDDFIHNTAPAAKDFEDIKKQAARPKWNNNKNNSGENREIKNAPKPEIAAPTPVVKNILSEVKITVLNRDTILNIRSYLLQRPAPLSGNATKVFLIVADKSIELPQGYSIEEQDAARLRAINGVINVQSSV